MLSLPSIYQRDESKPANFLRALVGVLETTTQTLDSRIAETPAAPRLGTDAVMGRTHLPDRAAALPTSANDAEPTLH